MRVAAQKVHRPDRTPARRGRAPQIHFEDNVYSFPDTVVVGGGKVLVAQQGGSFGAPVPGRLRMFGLATPVPVIDTRVLSIARAGTSYSTSLVATPARPASPGPSPPVPCPPGSA